MIETRVYDSQRARRDADFVKCCRSVLRSGAEGLTSVARVTRVAREMSPGAYYVGYDHAYRELTHFRAKGRFRVRGRARGLWESLRDDVEALQNRTGLSMSHALARALVECRPPRFYISQSTAAQIFRRRKRAWRSMTPISFPK